MLTKPQDYEDNYNLVDHAIEVSNFRYCESMWTWKHIVRNIVALVLGVRHIYVYKKYFFKHCDQDSSTERQKSFHIIMIA